MTTFDADKESFDLKALHAKTKNRPYSRSKLDEFKGELFALKAKGNTYQELLTWLRVKKNMSPAHTTLSRWFNKNADTYEKFKSK